jgi:hypothetical protein
MAPRDGAAAQRCGARRPVVGEAAVGAERHERLRSPLDVPTAGVEDGRIAPSAERVTLTPSGVTGTQAAQRSRTKRAPSRASCSSDSNIRRQIFVAAASEGSASPKASIVSQPS